MWAAYKGYPAVVDLLLSWGASCGVTDQEGFTALHWALVKGNYGCIQKLIQAGSDLSAKTNSGKTPATAADDMGSTRAWRRALKASNFNEDAVPVTRYSYFPFLRSRNFLQGAYFLFPFIFLPSLFALFSKFSVFVSVPIAFVLVFALQWAGQQLLLSTPTNLKHIQHTVSRRSCKVTCYSADDFSPIAIFSRHFRGIFVLGWSEILFQYHARYVRK